MPKLIVVNGPTASGKTGFAIKLAVSLGADIISSDSRQFYKEIPIGTAQPTEDELSKAQHHFIASHSVLDELNAGEYERLALQKLEMLFKNMEHVIMVGGSGMYEKAVCEGLDDLPKSDVLRQELNQRLVKEGLQVLQQQLRELDPEFHSQIDLHNPQRVIRALEVCLASGKPYSQQRTKAKKERPFSIVKFGMQLNRELLYERINKRVIQMVQNGFVEEAKSVYPAKHLNSLNTVGYKELFRHLDGQLSLEDAISEIQQNTRRFAKRQVTWYRRDDAINLLNPLEWEKALTMLKA